MDSSANSFPVCIWLRYEEESTCCLGSRKEKWPRSALFGFRKLGPFEALYSLLLMAGSPWWWRAGLESPLPPLPHRVTSTLLSSFPLLLPSSVFIPFPKSHFCRVPLVRSLVPCYSPSCCPTSPCPDHGPILLPWLLKLLQAMDALRKIWSKEPLRREDVCLPFCPAPLFIYFEVINV